MSLRKYTTKYIKPTRNRNKITRGWKTCINSVLVQLDINKWRLLKLAKLDKLYINSASNRLLQRSKIDLIEYKNQIFPNDSHINLRASNVASSYHCTSPITESNIPKWDFILDCCSDCTRNNAPCLESSEQLDNLFPASFQKIKFRIFQNISKCLIHRLGAFKYKNTRKLCDNTQEE